MISSTFLVVNKYIPVLLEFSESTGGGERGRERRRVGGGIE